MHWLVDLRLCNVYSVSPPIRTRFITDPKLQLLGLWYRVGLGCDWKTQHGTNVLHHMPNVGHDVIYRGVLGSCEGMEVCDWSNSCNLPIAVTSAVGLRCMRAVLYNLSKMLAVPSLIVVLAVLLIDLFMNTFINYIINIPILMFSFCKKMPYTPMSILTPRHLVGPNHGKRDSTY